MGKHSTGEASTRKKQVVVLGGAGGSHQVGKVARGRLPDTPCCFPCTVVIVRVNLRQSPQLLDSIQGKLYKELFTNSL